MRAVVHANGVPWQKKYLPLFQSGFKRHGLDVSHTPQDKMVSGAINVVFANNSWTQTVSECQRTGTPLLTVNRCFFGSRFDMVAIGWDGFNGDADFCLKRVMPNDRWELHGFEYPDWAYNPNGFVLVCGEYRALDSWYYRLRSSLAGIETKFRPHPFRHNHAPIREWGKSLGPAQDGIYQALEGARACVTFDSIAGCDSALFGIPTIAYGSKSMASDVSFPDWEAFVENDVLHEIDREPWVNRLAYCQWSQPEIEEGAFWEHLKIGLDARAGTKSRKS